MSIQLSRRIGWVAAIVLIPAALGLCGSAVQAQQAEASGDLEISRWDEPGMIASPVAITFDDAGRAYVTRTVRRRNSALPIRGHPEWMGDDLALETVADRRVHHKRKLDPSRSDENQWLSDHNGDGSHDWRDLTVQSDRIYRLADTDGDGKADEAKRFAAGFNSEVAGVAAGVLAHDGSIYATVVPHFWKLTDKDGDGAADERTSLVGGFGVHMGFSGHNMHGPRMGPDGRIYWSIGDIGASVEAGGRRWHYPHEGAVFRCEPDGSNFEVFATGLRNPQELAFDDHGYLFTVDNDSDRSGDAERIVHVVQGGDSGWRIHWQYDFSADYFLWVEEGLNRPDFDEQPAYVVPPVAFYSDGPAGFTRNPGTALSERWRDHFFLAEFTGSAAGSKVSAFTLEPEGASFRLDSATTVAQGILPTGLAFGPGGALYAADWIEGWVPHEDGRVWKIDAPKAAGSEMRAETRRLLAEGMGERSVERLSELLGHADQRVRMAAQFELVKRGEEGAEALLAAAGDRSRDRLARLHGVWGVGQLGREEAAAVEPLVRLLRTRIPTCGPRR